MRGDKNREDSLRERRGLRYKQVGSRHKKVLQGIAKGKAMSRAMLEAGYSKDYSKNPQIMAKTKSWQALLKENGGELKDKALSVTNGLLDDKDNWQARAKGVEITSKWLGLDKPDRQVSVNISVNDKQVEEFLKGIDGE